MESGRRSDEPLIPLGMRHLALKVKNMERARGFYERVLGMKVVWEPDPENVYLSSGIDNLALHSIPEAEGEQYSQETGQFLDHLGFIVGSPEEVEQTAKKMKEAGVPILFPPQFHRDGSCSFYMADPDGNKIQILYEPTLSKIKFQYPLGGSD